MSKSFKIASPSTFNATVSIPRVGGEPLSVGFTFKVMGRKELAKLYSAWGKEYKELFEKHEGEITEQYAIEEVALQVKQIKEIVTGWKFDDEFNDENLEELVDTVVSVTDAITSTYNEGYSKARRGN